jgi:hypothetical protein
VSWQLIGSDLIHFSQNSLATGFWEIRLATAMFSLYLYHVSLLALSCRTGSRNWMKKLSHQMLLIAENSKDLNYNLIERSNPVAEPSSMIFDGTISLV